MNEAPIVGITVSHEAYREIVSALQRVGGRGRARFGVIDLQGLLICAPLPTGDLPTYGGEKKGPVQINSAEALTRVSYVMRRDQVEFQDNSGRVMGRLVNVGPAYSGVDTRVGELMEAEERLLYRMLRAWDFDKWGEPAFYKHRQELVAMGPDFQPRLVSEIVGLAQVSVREGQYVPLLVKAEDHLEDGPIDVAERERLMEKVLAARAARTAVA